MDFIVWGKLLIVLLLVAGNAFFVGAEIALTSARRSRIKQLADTGNKSAKTVQVLHDEPERFYSVTQIGITLVSLALGAIGMVTISQIADPTFEAIFSVFGSSKGIINAAHTSSYVFAFIIISFLHVVAGELAPKVLAFHKAETMSLAVAGIVNAMYKIAKPVIWVMNHSSNGLLWLFGQKDVAGGHGEGHFSMSEEEIRTILSASVKHGILGADENKMIRGIFDLSEHTARHAMTHRIDVQGISKDAKLSELFALFAGKVRHARYPVFEGNMNKVVGVVHVKEVMNTIALAEDPATMFEKQISEVMYDPYVVPASMPLNELLRGFKAVRRSFAVVIDEFGATTGIITIEDLLEEIVGAYEDKYSSRRGLHGHVLKLEGSQYLIDANIRIAELEHAVNFPFPEGNYITLGGFMYQHIGRIPEVGDVLDMAGGRLEIKAMDHHRITKIIFKDLVTDEKGERLVEDLSPGQAIEEESSDSVEGGVKSPVVRKVKGSTVRKKAKQKEAV